MTKLEEAAKEYVEKEYWGNPHRLYEATDPFIRKALIAGAKWLLEQARFHSGIYAESVKPCVFLEDLEKLCENK